MEGQVLWHYRSPQGEELRESDVGTRSRRVRDTFVAAILEIARRDPQVVLLTGDLGFGVLTPFWSALPRQFINVGVAEQNLTGIATGLALSGHIVFTYSIANFPTLRCLEQIRNDACYHDANVKVVAVGGGFSYGALGISHHATEDLAVLRALPGMHVYCPADRAETAAVTHFAYETAGTCYIRLDKSSVDDTSTQGDAIVAGRARTLRTGKDATIIGVGGVLRRPCGRRTSWRGSRCSAPSSACTPSSPLTEAQSSTRAATRRSC